MKKIYLLLPLLAFLAISAFAEVDYAGDMKFTKTYKNPTGSVIFQHQKHAERFLDECGFCHSALSTFGGEVNELFGHTICKKCHESHNGPTECNECHKGDHLNISKK